MVGNSPDYFCLVPYVINSMLAILGYLGKQIVGIFLLSLACSPRKFLKIGTLRLIFRGI